MWWLILFATLTLVIGGLPLLISPALAKTVERWKETAKKWGNKWGVSPALVLAVIHRESKGNPMAKGPTADYGLMQITLPALSDFNRANFKNYTLGDLFQPDRNVEVGSWYLKWIREYLKTEDEKLILRAYNAGVGAVKKNPDISLGYAKSVLEFKTAIGKIPV